jgi:hypothetical protein
MSDRPDKAANTRAPIFCTIIMGPRSLLSLPFPRRFTARVWAARANRDRDKSISSDLRTITVAGKLIIHFGGLRSELGMLGTAIRKIIGIE